jgi:hypothetical protein
VLCAALVAFLLPGASASAQDALPAVSLGMEPVAAPASDAASQSTTALAEKLENPIGGLFIIPFQNNTNFNAGPHKGTQDILNIQPVIPIDINEDWNIITRTILPLVWNPSLRPAQSVPFGTAPTTFSAFLSPKNPTNGWLGGVGPLAQLPTISSKTLGSNVWGLGPAAVIVYAQGPIVAGGLLDNAFSLGGTTVRRGTGYSLMTFQPFLNYNFGDGWFVGTVPIITADWQANGAKWTIPVGAQAGRLIKLEGKLPVNLLTGFYYNADRERYGATWQWRTQVAIVF